MNRDILAAPTPTAWVDEAARRWPELLSDHANCEKKAASTALALMFAYADDRRLSLRLARLAREELRHFEQVDKLMQQLGVEPLRLAPGRYASALRREVAAQDPQRKQDLLLCGALIEARSCERFVRLAPHLPPVMGGFYADLAEAEQRHGVLYLQLAADAAARLPEGESGLERRLAALAAVEAELATSPDVQFRFHSGPPAEAA
ncbi:MAG: hypothetical protein RL026_1213 [Pseudomonadota bacterium]